MKKLQTLALTLALVGLALVTTAITGQARTGTVLKLNIEFDFQVGQHKFVAGEYQVRQLNAETFLLRGADKNEQILIKTLTSQATNKGAAQLVFHRYDGQYFLAEVQMEQFAATHRVYPSDDELRARKNAEDARRLARGKFQPERVTVTVE